MAGELVITNFDTGGIVIGNAEYQDELLKFAGADTIAEGTILARDPADDTIVPCCPSESDGTEIPIGVLTIECIHTGGAGNESIRMLVAGKVRAEKLIYDDATVLTVADYDAIRVNTQILPLPVDERGMLDNQ